jgi:hypothetical protein
MTNAYEETLVSNVKDKKASPRQARRTSYISLMASITKAASRENNEMNEAIAYIGTITMIRTTILLQEYKQVYIKARGEHTVAELAFDNS